MFDVMSASQSLGGSSRLGRVLGPSLDKIIKNVAWRKHSHLVAAAKSSLDLLQSLTDASPSPPFSLFDPLIYALQSNSPKVIEPALDCSFKLFSLGLFCNYEIVTVPKNNVGSNKKENEKDGNVNGNVIDSSNVNSDMVFRLIESVCKCGTPGEDAIELAMLRCLLAVIRSNCILVRGDVLVSIVKTCYNVYLGSLSGTNQICAKAVLAQIMIIVFSRVEDDRLYLKEYKIVMVGGLLEFADRGLNEGSSIQFTQNFVNEIMESSEGVPDPKFLGSLVMKSEENGGDKEVSNGEEEEKSGSKIRDDGFVLFKNLCKLSMKFSTQEHSDDQILLRGKVLSLELLKVIMDNGGPIWRTNDRFLNVMKQYLCLSLLKNSALSVMTVFQLLCSILSSLLSKYRSGLKAEIGIFFPMLILCVLENVLQPSFLQKMTVLNLMEKISRDPQTVVDIFVNYDCDLDAPNIFERIVNGLLKTAMGPPAGSTTTLSPIQDITFRLESVKCLNGIIKSMGSWMDQQLKVGESSPPKSFDSDFSLENNVSLSSEEGAITDYELHPEAGPELSNAATLEQRRAYKIEFQKGIALFNRKPSKGIEFLVNTKKIGDAPEDVASFLKNTSGLNEAIIGDYLGERDEFPIKVMHAYVDSFNFEAMVFGEAIRFFLRGFRLPGEAQKIDRIMEKFAERYCKCNPSSFTSADTAYVLAYSVIMLNTDAHNSMVKDKMTKVDFIRNNRGIDDGKDLPEEYLGALYDQIVKNEIKMKADSSAPQSKQANSLNKLLGLDGILNLVTGKQTEEKPLGANGVLVKHIQEQFKANSGKSESVFVSVSDVAILRFMMEVCWGPMLAAFSVTLDQSDDKIATTHSLLGFRFAVHVTAVMGMQTQRDAFVTSVAKFTLLHSVGDMKQKNVDAVKAIIAIAIEDGNYLQEAWEHILTCLSRFEHLQLLGDGAPSDASFLVSSIEVEDKTLKSPYPALKKKGTLQNPAVAAVVRGGSYDSTTTGANTTGLVTPEQINNFILNLHLLDQIGSFELNHIFGHSQRLNSEAIVAFVKALCKVSMSELQSPMDPRVFSLTKIVEIAHYNMNRIRLVWSRIWNVLSDFFVSVGLSENLSVAIFVMDSLRQLAMKFLEREELANYNFQNEFLRPFVIVMRKSNSTEIRELIVRCISQMVLSRVSNVKSGWKSVFMVFTAAAADERKNVVLLAFETMEKIVREYFPYITETETVTFTDCVRCLITFTSSRFNSDVSLNAIAFLRFCAVKLAEGGLVCNEKSKENDAVLVADEDASNRQNFSNKDELLSFWIPLLTGLSKLTSDPRSAIRKSSLEVLFNILKDHGHLFSSTFWICVFTSAVFPIFHGISENSGVRVSDTQDSSASTSPHPEGSMWDSETTTVAVQCLIDLFVSFFITVRSLLPEIVAILTGLIRSPVQGTAGTGISSLLQLVGELGSKFTEDEWKDIFLGLKEAASSTLPRFQKVVRSMDNVELPDSLSYDDGDTMSESQLPSELDSDNLQTAGYVISRVKSHIAVQLLVIKVVADLYKAHYRSLSAAHISILLEICSSISAHAHQLNSESKFKKKLNKTSSVLELSDPPMVNFEIESHQIFLNLLQSLLLENPKLVDEMNIEVQLVAVCQKILEIYLTCAGTQLQKRATQLKVHRVLPLGPAKKEELATRTSLTVSALQALSELDRYSFKRYVSQFFPLLTDLVRSEHNSREVQVVLSNMFQSCIGPVLMES